MLEMFWKPMFRFKQRYMQGDVQKQLLEVFNEKRFS